MDDRRKTLEHDELLQRLEGLLQGEKDPWARMANLCAELHFGRGYFWTGWYRVVGNELILGPFQGPTACGRIAKGKGVCGNAWENEEVTVVPDVDEFPGHIACSPESRSEIVLPVKDAAGKISAVLDIDSDRVNAFDDMEREFLEAVVERIEPLTLP